MDVTEMSFAEFTPDEVAAICGPWLGPRLVWPADGGGGPQSLRLKETIALMARNEPVARGRPPLSRAVARACVPSILWFALMDGESACEIEGPLEARPAFELEYDSLVARIAGVAVDGVMRFLFWAGSGKQELVKERDFLSSLDLAAKTPEGQAGFFIDLAKMGLRFAELSGRPLVTCRVAVGPRGRAGL